MRRSTAVVVVLASVVAAAWPVLHAWRVVPSRWNPWAPLDVDEAPNWLTRFKLARLEHDGDACRATLAQTSFRFRPLADRETAPGCGLHDAVSVVAADVSLGAPLTLTCSESVALALWERYSVQPAAERWYGEPVTRLENFGSYACRNVYGREDAPRSEHATANAIDVAGFVLADGRRVHVVDAWRGHSIASRFLHDVDAGACRYFDAVLDPDYNAAHRDHLHLDRGPYRFCR